MGLEHQVADLPPGGKNLPENKFNTEERKAERQLRGSPSEPLHQALFEVQITPGFFSNFYYIFILFI